MSSGSNLGQVKLAIDKDYELKDIISSSFGGIIQTFKAIRRKDFQSFNVKVFDMSKVPSPVVREIRDSIINSIKIWSSCNAPIFCQLYGYQEINNTFLCLTDPLTMTLKNKASETPAGKKTQALFNKTFSAVIQALYYLQETLKKQHYNINNNNIFVDEEGNIKIDDFFLDYKFLEQFHSNGAIEFQAPELASDLKGKDISKADIYSLALVLIFIVGWQQSDVILFRSKDNALDSNLQKVYEKIPEGYRMIIKEMHSHAAGDRPSINILYGFINVFQVK